MPTTATAFAVTTRVSKNPAELRLRVLHLYRQFMRHSPQFVEMYDLAVPVGLVHTVLRQQFERNRFVEDINVRNHLLAKGNMEFQETVNFWKQTPHVAKYFDNYHATQIEKPAEDFVRKFIKGTA